MLRHHQKQTVTLLLTDAIASTCIQCLDTVVWTQKKHQAHKQYAQVIRINSILATQPTREPAKQKSKEKAEYVLLCITSSTHRQTMLSLEAVSSSSSSSDIFKVA